MAITILPQRAHTPKSPAEAIRLASCDPIANHRRELLERNEHLCVPPVPKRLSDETKRRLALIGLGTTEHDRETPEPTVIDWEAMKRRNVK